MRVCSSEYGCACVAIVALSNETANSSNARAKCTSECDKSAHTRLSQQHTRRKISLPNRRTIRVCALNSLPSLEHCATSLACGVEGLRKPPCNSCNSIVLSNSSWSSPYMCANDLQHTLPQLACTHIHTHTHTHTRTSMHNNGHTHARPCNSGNHSHTLRS